jgi:antitoxin component YwqK of YwqJK toxin-antitoxin module
MPTKLSFFQLFAATLSFVAVLASAPVGVSAPPAPLPGGPRSLNADDFQSLVERTPAFAAGGIEPVVDRYPDGKAKIERQVVLDSTGNYVNHGEWKHLDPKGNVIAQGHFDMGKRIGPWVRWHSPRDTAVLKQFPFNKYKPPFQSQANFSDDKMDGEWLITDASQRKCMQVSLSAGKRNGTTTVWLPNGVIFSQATYDEGVRAGDVMEADQKGELKRVATYIEGRSLSTKLVKGRGKHPKKSEEQFLAPKAILKTPDDFWSLTLAEYTAEGDAVHHGPSTIWHDNGQLQQQGYYQYGKKSGAFTFHYENGQVAATGEYKDDVPEGLWIWSHRNGQKATVGEYRAGQPVGQWRWWKEDGMLASEKSYGDAALADELHDGMEIGRIPGSEPPR